ELVLDAARVDSGRHEVVIAIAERTYGLGGEHVVEDVDHLLAIRLVERRHRAVLDLRKRALSDLLDVCLEAVHGGLHLRKPCTTRRLAKPRVVRVRMRHTCSRGCATMAPACFAGPGTSSTSCSCCWSCSRAGSSICSAASARCSYSARGERARSP